MEKNSNVAEKKLLPPLILGGIFQALPLLSPGSPFLITVSSLLWPFLFLNASRRAATKRQFWLVMAVLAFSKFLRNMLLYGASPLYMLGIFMLSAFIALCESLAFGLDRLATRRDTPLASLVFPILFTGSNCLIAALSIGNLTDPGAALAHLHVFAQSASLILEHGLCFILAWVSSMLNLALNGEGRRKIVCISVSVLLIVIMVCFGLTTLAGRKDPSSTIRVAFCTSYEESFDSVSSEKSEEDFIVLVDDQLTQAVENGAELVIFVEEHTCLSAETLFSSIDTISGIVKKHGVPVLLPIEVTMHDGGKNINEAILFDENGVPVLTYVKNNLVPLIESRNYESGPEQVGQAVIRIGNQSYKVAVVICFDSSDAAFVNKMDPDTEILLCPAWEWSTCNEEQMRTIILRAVENGVTLVKATQDGYHAVADPYGNVVFSEYTVGRYEIVSVADVPVYRKQKERPRHCSRP